ncbi:major strawberry allergen Fra a 1-2-like [Malania oleifera]|uniref:major strawberry allergen Fra a 1-2-like n=1 Tax=Malania oleifera TaxID=397392 RepID=UPI0025AE977B|nr:major strawberry allergen Fra a 1-2-like [Malania oleifera]
MGVMRYSQENTSPVPPARFYRALIRDAHKLVPKLLPAATKSIEILQRVGGAHGTILLICFSDGKQAKHRFDAMDDEKYVCRYTLIEGEVLKSGIESIVYETKFEALADGGSICKRTVEVNATLGAEIQEEEIKASNERAEQLYKAVEAYLLENLTAYA